MSDLIRRKDMIDALEQRLKDDYLDGYELLKYIKDLPSAEPEREKGKWVRRKDGDCWECSECHSVLENSDIGNHNFYYCYHCGADMMDICGYMDSEKANYE